MIEQSSPLLCNSDYKDRINFVISKMGAVIRWRVDFQTPTIIDLSGVTKLVLAVFIEFYNLMEGYDT